MRDAWDTTELLNADINIVIYGTWMHERMGQGSSGTHVMRLGQDSNCDGHWAKHVTFISQTQNARRHGVRQTNIDDYWSAPIERGNIIQMRTLTVLSRMKNEEHLCTECKRERQRSSSKRQLCRAKVTGGGSDPERLVRPISRWPLHKKRGKIHQRNTPAHNTLPLAPTAFSCQCDIKWKEERWYFSRHEHLEPIKNYRPNVKVVKCVK